MEVANNNYFFRIKKYNSSNNNSNNTTNNNNNNHFTQGTSPFNKGLIIPCVEQYRLRDNLDHTFCVSHSLATQPNTVKSLHSMEGPLGKTIYGLSIIQVAAIHRYRYSIS